MYVLLASLQLYYFMNVSKNPEIVNNAEKLLVGGLVGKFPPFFVFIPSTHKIEQQKNRKNGSDHGLTTAPFPPNPFSMHCSHPPPSSRNSIFFAKKLPILATSWRDARRGRCRDVARISFSVALQAYLLWKNAHGPKSLVKDTTINQT
jgi:hypothetical protein